MSETEILLSNKLIALEKSFAEFEAKSIEQNLLAQKIIAQQKAIIQEQSLTIQQLKHRVEQLLKQLYGVRSEKLPVLQTNLFDPLPFTEQELEPVQPEVKTNTIVEHQRKEKKKDPKSLRYQLPEHLR
jgi:hypothetical protein